MKSFKFCIPVVRLWAMRWLKKQHPNSNAEWPTITQMAFCYYVSIGFICLDLCSQSKLNYIMNWDNYDEQKKREEEQTKWVEMEINLTNQLKKMSKRQVNCNKTQKNILIKKKRRKSHHVTLLRSIDIFIVVEDAGRKCNHRFRRNWTNS